MKERIIQIADRFKRYYFDTLLVENNMSIFLCGGSKDTENDFRYGLGNEIAKKKSKFRYSVYYPEDMFVELILGHQRRDLLTLENLLAKSASATVILLTSEGTFTELGAFSNHDSLKEKLIVVVDPRYRNANSFINKGPIQYLTKNTGSRILYETMHLNNLQQLANKIVPLARDINSTTPPTYDLTNPIICYEFYLALIYIFDPIPRDALLNIGHKLQNNFVEEVSAATETIINSLINQRDALLVSGNLRISPNGIKTLFSKFNTDKSKEILRNNLSEFRIEALNVTLRKNPKGVWGEAA